MLKAAAHLITADHTPGLMPTLVIATRLPEGGVGEEIERHDLDDLESRQDPKAIVVAFGWEPDGDILEVEPGYYCIPVVKSEGS